MALATFNDFLSRWCAGYGRRQPIWGEIQTTKVAPLGNSFAAVRFGRTRVMPGSLPTGVTAFIPTSFSLSSTNISNIFAFKAVDLGSLDISGASGTFTDGSAMPTVSECGVSRQPSSPILVVTTTALNATPGTLSVTYTDQDGNTGNVQTAALAANSTVDGVEFLPFLSGDVGAIDITAASRSAGTTPTGVLKFYGMIPIGIAVPCLSPGYGVADMITGQINPVRLGVNDEVIFLQLDHGNSFTGATTGMLNLVGDN